MSYEPAPGEYVPWEDEELMNAPDGSPTDAEVIMWLRAAVAGAAEKYAANAVSWAQGADHRSPFVRFEWITNSKNAWAEAKRLGW